MFISFFQTLVYLFWHLVLYKFPFTAFLFIQLRLTLLSFAFFFPFFLCRFRFLSCTYRYFGPNRLFIRFFLFFWCLFLVLFHNFRVVDFSERLVWLVEKARLSLLLTFSFTQLWILRCFRRKSEFRRRFKRNNNWCRLLNFLETVSRYVQTFSLGVVIRYKLNPSDIFQLQMNKIFKPHFF